MKLSQDEPARVLASGIDSLVLAINVRWRNELAFAKLRDLKNQAKGEHADQSAVHNLGSEQTPLICTVKPHGGDGYEWFVESRELTLNIGKWIEPMQRPSVMASIRSEALWTHGPEAMVRRICDVLLYLDADIINVKPSRVDLCGDLLLPAAEWHLGLLDCFVTRAIDIAPRLQHRQLSGFTLGSGPMSARLYDKPREIVVKSKKFWMYDIWGVESVAEDHRIIRNEFQMRREVLKELGIDTWEDLLRLMPRVWAYCTKKWLRLVDDASLHHTQQKLLPWWAVLQDGFAGAQGAQPLVRKKAIQQDLDRQVAQLMGGFSSVAALLRQGELIDHGDVLDVRSHIAMIADLVQRETRLDEDEFTERVKRKQAKQLRNGPDFKDSPGAPLPLAVSSSKASKRRPHGTV